MHFWSWWSEALSVSTALLLMTFCIFQDIFLISEKSPYGLWQKYSAKTFLTKVIGMEKSAHEVNGWSGRIWELPCQNAWSGRLAPIQSNWVLQTWGLEFDHFCHCFPSYFSMLGGLWKDPLQAVGTVLVICVEVFRSLWIWQDFAKMRLGLRLGQSMHVLRLFVFSLCKANSDFYEPILFFSGQSSQPSWSSDAKVASILCDVALLRQQSKGSSMDWFRWWFLKNCI